MSATRENKRPSEPKNEFWLVVFTTDMGFFPEIADAEFEDVGVPLEYAQDYLKRVGTVFDQIWYINIYKGALLLVWGDSL